MALSHQCAWAVALSLVTAVAPAQSTAVTDLVEHAASSTEAGDHDRAVHLLEQAVAADPSKVELRQRLAVALSHQGAALHRSQEPGSLDAAIAAFRRADALWPKQPALLLGLGSLLEHRGERREADGLFERVLRLHPENPGALAGLGRGAVYRDQTQKASEYFARARDAAPARRDYAAMADKYARHAAVERDYRSLRIGVFTVLYPPGRARGVESAVPAVRGWLCDALRDLRRDLGRTPSRSVRVILYGAGQYREVSTAKHWATAYYDGSVRLDFSDWEARRDKLQAELRHELAHAFLDRLYPGLPPWIHEGYAQVMDGRSLDVARATLAGRGLLEGDVFLRDFVESEHVDVVRRGYAQAMVAVAELRDERTGREFARLLAAVAQGMPSALAVREVYGRDLLGVVRAAVPGR